ncbi:MAG: phytoene desaturase family protein, partial [Anaerolineae bacterium]|nr:phytoene desaturase family protein [Anaerolineae bacterium]
EVGDYRFDSGATLYLMPEVFEQTFADLGRRRADYYELLKVDPNYRVHFHDGSSLALRTDLVAMREELEHIEPGAFRNYLAFLAEGGQNYDLSLRHFLGRRFDNPFQFFAPAHLPLMLRMRVLQRHFARVAHYFRSDRLHRALTFQTMYLGSSPFDALATYTLLQYAELAGGIYLPRGGMYAIVEAFERILREEGGVLACGSPVQAILLDGRRVKGVLLADGTHVPADLVVANADVPYVYERLLPHPDATREARRLRRLRYTSSAVMFYWGLDRRYDEQLPAHHNVFLAADYRGSFERIFHGYSAPTDPSFYVASPVRTDPRCAPPGCEAWVVLVPVGHLKEGVEIDWRAQTLEIRAHVLRRLAALGMPDLAEHIACERSQTPRDYAQALNLVRGSAFGLAHNLRQVGYFRPHNRARRFPGLYFVGASTHPGTGLPLVLLSARLTAERMLDDWRAGAVGPA